MIKSGVKLQLVVFAIITVLGMTYTAVRIVGIGQGIFDLRYKAYVDLADSGGIFSNAEVTYRGVAVGRVGPLRLTADGVRVELRLNRGTDIPARAEAFVLNRSGVGEQYIDLRPDSGDRPYLADLPENRRIIPRDRTHLPVSTADLLMNLDRLLTSVNPGDVSTVIDELAKGFAGTGADLQALLDAQKQIIDAADATYPETARLLNNGRTVLDTQRESSTAIRQFSRDLASLTDAIRESDPDIRGLIDVTPDAIQQSDDLLDGLEPTLPVLLANGSVVGEVLTARIPNLRQLLITYPLQVAGSFTAVPGDGTAHFGLELNMNNPPVCTRGYEDTEVRFPQDTSTVRANRNASCKEPEDSPIAVRGSRNAPNPAPSPQLPPGATDGAGFPDRQGQGSGAAARSSTASDGTQTNSGTQTNGDTGTSLIPGVPDDSPLSALQGVYMTGYDPQTRVFLGPDGKRYRLGATGGQQLTGDASWQWLLLGPLAG